MIDVDSLPIIDLGWVTFVDQSDGSVRVQIQGDGIGATTPPFQTHTPYGLFSVPRDPDTVDGLPVAGCVAAYWYEGDRGHAMVCEDARALEKLPKSAHGTVGLYAQRDDGLVSFVKIDGKTGAFFVNVPTAGGYINQLELSAENGFVVSTPDATMRLGPYGFHAVTSSGARVDCGALGGLPAPFSALSSYAQLVGGVATVQGGVVNLGSDGGLANNTAVLALIALVTELVTALGEISTTPAAVGAPVFTPAQLAPLTVALAAFLPLAPGIGRVV